MHTRVPAGCIGTHKRRCGHADAYDAYVLCCAARCAGAAGKAAQRACPAPCCPCLPPLIQPPAPSPVEAHWPTPHPPAPTVGSRLRGGWQAVRRWLAVRPPPVPSRSHSVRAQQLPERPWEGGGEGRSGKRTAGRGGRTEACLGAGAERVLTQQQDEWLATTAVPRERLCHSPPTQASMLAGSPATRVVTSAPPHR